MIDEHQRIFRDRVIMLAKKIAPDYSLDWQLMAATAILETGWGKSELARFALNLFGIKATDSTPEDEVYILGEDRFRKYQSEEDSFRSYGWLMSQSSHYAPAREQARLTYLRVFVAHMAPVYCPPDPKYAVKLLELIHMLGNLERR